MGDRIKSKEKGQIVYLLQPLIGCSTLQFWATRLGRTHNANDCIFFHTVEEQKTADIFIRIMSEHSQRITNGIF